MLHAHALCSDYNQSLFVGTAFDMKWCCPKECSVCCSQGSDGGYLIDSLLWSWLPIDGLQNSSLIHISNILTETWCFLLLQWHHARMIRLSALRFQAVHKFLCISRCRICHCLSTMPCTSRPNAANTQTCACKSTCNFPCTDHYSLLASINIARCIMIVQAKDQERVQHIYSRLRPHVTDFGLCMELSGLIHSMLSTSIVNRCSAAHVAMQLQKFL